MKKHVLVPVALSCCAALAAAVASAAPPPGASAHGPPGMHEHGSGPGPGHEDGDDEHHRHGRHDLRDAAEAAGGRPPHAGDDDAHGHGPGRHGPPPGLRELLDELRAGKLKKGELKDRLAELREHRDERLKEHREELKTRLGAALGSPAVREELERHGRRMARLHRALILCETESVKDKDKLKERITKLIERENERHERDLDRLKSPAAAPGASAVAAPSSAPPTPSAAPATSVKGGQ